MNRAKRFKVLLERGYFPEELPPPFFTRPLAEKRNRVVRDWRSLNEEPPKTIPETWSIPRIGRQRRRLAIVNPISQTILCDEICKNWPSISRFLRSSRISLHFPNVVEDSERAIPPPDFTAIDLRRQEIGAQYSHMLVSDISRFYGTVYTHVIPWALHGKRWSKANMHSPQFATCPGNQLDIKVRKGQDNQTIGIPIGPDTSRIISEIVAIGIEKSFLNASNISRTRVFRYVDDWFIGFDGGGEAEDAVSHLSSACNQYELELNAEKTRVIEPATPLSQLWPMELQSMRVSRPKLRQAKEITHYFQKAFHLFDEAPGENILLYALKKSRSFHVHPDNFSLYENYLYRAARANASVIPVLVQILVNSRQQGLPIDQGKAKKFIEDTIARASPLAHHCEVAWSLFLAKGLGLKLSRKSILPALSMECSVVALLVLDLRRLSLLPSNINLSFWQSFMNADALRSHMWLLAYEADFKRWLPSPSIHVDNDPFFGVLKSNGVYFYDIDRNVPTFRKSIRADLQRQRNTLFYRTFHELPIGGLEYF